MSKIKKKDIQLYDQVYNVFTNGGSINSPLAEDSDTFSIEDLVTSEDIAPFVPKVVKRIIVEAVQPNQLIIPNLFTQVNIPQGQMVEIGSIGAIAAGRIAQGDIYPENTLSTDTVGATVNITVSKFGCAINISDEAIKDNQFDVITLWLRAAGAALARLKENQALKLVNSMGVTVFDNANPADAELGSLTGRNIAAAPNGSMTLNDLFDMWAYLSLRGFNPDTLIMNPLAWKVFAVDPELREIVLKGATLATRRMPLGSGNNQWSGQFTPEGVGPKYQYTGDEDGVNAYTQNVTPVGATWNVPPQYLPSPLKVLVTHLVPFSERAADEKPITNIIMADSQRCGILVQRENPTTKEADIFARDVHAVHIYERYGMGLFDQGKGVAVARNVVVDRNYIFDNVNSQSLSTIDQTQTPSEY
jgi:hypothetical protein